MDNNGLPGKLDISDPESFYKFMETHNKLLWVVAGSILKNVGTAEDIEECVSDVYIHLLLNPDAYDPLRGSLKTYLVTVAKSKAIDRYRQLAKNKTTELDDFFTASDNGILEDIIRRERQASLYEVIATLGEPNKEILTRRYYFNEKPSHIANVMSLPVKEVENRLYQSKQRLRKLLQEES